MSFEQDRLKDYPNSMPQNEFLSHLYKVLVEKGFGQRNTIVGVSVCREQPSHLLIEEIRNFWPTVFDFSSLAGMQFVGKSGFLKMRKSVNYEEGSSCFLYMAFPHIGWTSDGQLGRIDPPGLGKPYPACGGLVAFQEELASGSSPWEPDPDNLEQGLLNQRMFQNMKYGGGSNLIALTNLAYTTILKDIERIAALSLTTQGNPYAIVTGIQLNGPEKQNFVWPGEMYELRDNKKSMLFLT